MRNKRILRFFILGLVISAFIAGCAKEDDPSPTPGAPDRDKFFGTWYVTSNHTQVPLPQYWYMTISAGNSSADQIQIKDFDYQMGTTIFATVSGNSFSFAPQTIKGEVVQGGGIYSNGSLSFSYTAVDTQTDSVTATATK